MITSHIGCGHLYSFDGNWKLVYPVCMFRVPKEVTGFSHHLRYVDTCPNEPVCGHAFCEVHCNEAEDKKIPTKLRDYLRYCGILKGTYVATYCILNDNY